MVFYSPEDLRDAVLGQYPSCRLQLHDRIDSTNLEALRSIESGNAKAGDLHIAREQSAGRGTGDRAWWSPKDSGLWLTRIVSLKSLPSPPAFLPGLAAVESLLDLGFDAHIKWPNDILIGAKKVGGCLIQVATHPGDEALAAVGLGLNLYQTSFPDEVAGSATSLSMETETPPGAAKVLQSVLAAWDRLAEEDDLIPHFGRHTRMLQRPLKALEGSRVVACVAEGLDPQGHLLVRLPDGSKAVWASGDRHRVIIEDEWATRDQ